MALMRRILEDFPCKLQDPNLWDPKPYIEDPTNKFPHVYDHDVVSSLYSNRYQTEPKTSLVVRRP